MALDGLYSLRGGFYGSLESEISRGNFFSIEDAFGQISVVRRSITTACPIPMPPDTPTPLINLFCIVFVRFGQRHGFFSRQPFSGSSSCIKSANLLNCLPGIRAAGRTVSRFRAWRLKEIILAHFWHRLPLHL